MQECYLWVWPLPAAPFSVDGSHGAEKQAALLEAQPGGAYGTLFSGF